MYIREHEKAKIEKLRAEVSVKFIARWKKLKKLIS